MDLYCLGVSESRGFLDKDFGPEQYWGMVQSSL